MPEVVLVLVLRTDGAAVSLTGGLLLSMWPDATTIAIAQGAQERRGRVERRSRSRQTSLATRTLFYSPSGALEAKAREKDRSQFPLPRGERALATLR